jgi:hypothetical protein
MGNFKFAAAAASWLLAGAATALPGLPRCFPVSVKVAVSARNAAFDDAPPPNNETAIVDWSVSDDSKPRLPLHSFLCKSLWRLA